MKLIPILLLAVLSGFYLGISGCEKSPGATEVCASQTTERLGLVQEPQLPCRMSVFLIQTAEEIVYEVSSATCYIEPVYFTCAGEQIPRDRAEASQFLDAATTTTLLGYLPGN